MAADKFAAARDAMLAEVERVQAAARARRPNWPKSSSNSVAATLATRKTMQGQAQDLGSSWMAASDLNFSERYLAAARQVTPAALQRVARQYLTPANRTLYALLPQGAAPKPQTKPLTSPSNPPCKKSFSPTACACWSRKTIACRSSRCAPSFRAACWPKASVQQRPHPTRFQDAAPRHPPAQRRTNRRRHRIRRRQHRQFRRQQQFRFDSRGLERRFQEPASTSSPMSCSTLPSPARPLSASRPFSWN